jgi:serine/threonine protein kinase/Tfp pilus assembly protein PilF
MTNNPLQVDDIFDEALRRVPGKEREQYLNEACDNDAELRQRVARLLRAVAEAGSFLESPAQDPSPTIDQPIAERPGTQIGPYKLLQQIGEGGMGVVYMADQLEPVKRRVALKIIKPGMDTRQVIARFEAERQALSLMDHPNIAKVLDAGTTESGRPYFVMELVKGQPITQYCDEHHLTPRQRLELLLPVCQAIQHAHQKGIIHRDIKPTNILIAEYDQKAVPKVIDFGVAKATSQTLTEMTMFTEYGQIVGTLEYMSPEQAKVNQLDIDTRSDIYSLGVLLYELLTGSTPFDRERLRSAGWDEMLRIIREEEPPKPSTKLSSSQTLPSVAANRSMEPARLGRALRGELDWIVMKALEKDRSRRYETATGLANDIQRYLNDEPVAACPPSAAYRFQKFSRRHQRVLISTTFVFAALTVGLVAALWQSYLATQEASKRRSAEESLRLANDERLRADELLAFARKELNSSRVAEAEAKRAKQAAALQAEQAEDESLQARKSMQLASEMERRARQTLEEIAAVETNPNEATSQFVRALVFRRLGKNEEALDILRRLVEIEPDEARFHHALGTLSIEKSAYPEAVAAFRQAVALQPQNAAYQYALGNALARNGEYREAASCYEAAIQIQPDIAGARHEQIEALARSEDWQTAAVKCGELIALTPREPWAWLRTAPFLVLANDAEAYRNHCRKLIEQFGETDAPYIASKVGLACLLLPAEPDSAPQLPSGLVSVLSNDPKQDRSSKAALSLLAYRRQDPAAAIRLVKEVLQKRNNAATLAIVHAVAAMAYHQLRQADKARESFEQAAEFSRSLTMSDWYAGHAENQIARILIREAETTLSRPNNES